MSLLGFWQAPQFAYAFGGWRTLVATGPSAAVSGLALWLAGRAEEEIFIANGRLGGVGFCRTARSVAMVTLAVAAITVILIVLDTALGIDIGV